METNIMIRSIMNVKKISEYVLLNRTEAKFIDGNERLTLTQLSPVHMSYSPGSMAPALHLGPDRNKRRPGMKTGNWVCKNVVLACRCV